jgi:DNA-binding MarR family transcriptional regulator
MSVQSPRRPVSAQRTETLEGLGRSFKALTAALRRLRGRETHHPGELSYAQYGMLFGLADGTPKSARDLALAADVSPATATEMLDAMAASGLVARTRSEEDRRIVLTALTERGKAVVDQRRARYEPLWQAALQDFTESELRSAAAILDALRQMFDELADSES